VPSQWWVRLSGAFVKEFTGVETSRLTSGSADFARPKKYNYERQYQRRSRYRIQGIPILLYRVILNEVLEKRQRILGDEHPDTLVAMYNLAFMPRE
jgi:hypothetical protein